MIYFGTSRDATLEAVAALSDSGITVDSLRLRAFPFDASVDKFIAEHDTLFLVEQNRDAQLKSLLRLELTVHDEDLTEILHYNGLPMNAQFVIDAVNEDMAKGVAA